MKNLLFLICIITFWACSSVSEGEPEPEPIPYGRNKHQQQSYLLKLSICQ